MKLNDIIHNIVKNQKRKIDASVTSQDYESSTYKKTYILDKSDRNISNRFDDDKMEPSTSIDMKKRLLDTFIQIINPKDKINADIELIKMSDDTGNKLIDSDDKIENKTRKGRKRKFELNREERKIRKYKNLPYVNSKNEMIDAKIFIDFDCKCPLKCNKLTSLQKRQTEFKKFYELGTYNAQSMFIAECVKENPVKRSYVSKNEGVVHKKKQFSRTYYISGARVCRNMFVKTLQTTPKRVDSALKKMRSDCCITDKRGKRAGGWNKTAEEDELFVVNHLQKMQRCITQYHEIDCDGKYYNFNMSLKMIYNLYATEVEKSPRKKVSYPKFRNIYIARIKPELKNQITIQTEYENEKNSLPNNN